MGLAERWAGGIHKAMDSFLEGSLADGVSFTGVVSIQELGGSGSFAGKLLISGAKVFVFLQTDTDLQNIQRVALIDSVVVLSDGQFKLFQTHDSRVFLHTRFLAQDLLRVKEACSGIGALGRGGEVMGYKVVALNEMQPVTARAAEVMTGAPVVVGDINSMEVVAGLWAAAPGNCTFTSGFSCQPYSRLGDRRSGEDPRSSALTGSLKAAFLLQSSVVILECVQPAETDEFVQGCLRAFQDATHFHCSQTVLELHKVWGARRTRWWAILSSPDVGQVPLCSWKPHGPWHSVESIVDTFNATGSEIEQLTLREDELALFEELKPMSAYCLRRDQPLPTALHSWGSALQACPCGCRQAPFSIARLKRDGLCSVVLPLCETDECTGFRYPTAQEVALLNGLSPSLDYGSNAKLGLALTGQLAWPLQPAWLFGAVARAVFPGTLDAVQILHTQRCLLLRQAEIEGYRPFTGGHVLSECPAICFDTHCSIVRKAVSCRSVDLPPFKKARTTGEMPSRRRRSARALQSCVRSHRYVWHCISASFRGPDCC